MHAHDDGFVAKVDGLKQFRQLLRIVKVLRIAVVGHRFHIVEVGTRTKTLAVAFQDDDADVIAAVEPIEGFGQLTYHRIVQCVANLWTVKVDPGHAFAQLYFYRGEFHFR